MMIFDIEKSIWRVGNDFLSLEREMGLTWAVIDINMCYKGLYFDASQKHLTKIITHHQASCPYFSSSG